MSQSSAQVKPQVKSILGNQESTYTRKQGSYKALPIAGKREQNKRIIYVGAIYLSVGGLLLIWK